MRTDILGVGFDDLTLDEAARAGAALVERGGFHYAVTPNPEFLLEARTNAAFRQTLLDADLVLADGIGDTGNVIGSEVLIDASAPTVSSKMNYRAHAQTPHSVWIMVRMGYTRNMHSAPCRHQHSPFGQMLPRTCRQ